MKVEYNNWKFYRAVITICGCIGISILACTLVTKSSSWIYFSIFLSTVAALFYIYVLSGGLLKGRFNRLGSVLGKTKTEIESAVGAADEMRTYPDGRLDLVWTMTNYKIKLEFVNDVCRDCREETKP